MINIRLRSVKHSDNFELLEKIMLKAYEIDKPILETDRLIIRVLNENDVPDL